MSRPTTPLPSGGPNIPKSSTEPFSTPPRSNTHHHHKPSRPHVPHQPHRAHRHHRTHSSQQVPQSAITGPSHSPFGDFLTKTKSSLADPFPSSASALVGLGGTRTPPRTTGDIATANHNANAATTTTAGSLDVGGNERDSNRAKEEEEAEREKRRRRQQQQKWSTVSTRRRQRAEAEEDLAASLAQLSTLSTTTTRRFDDTYYALLSSLAGLRAGIGSLRGLARETRSLLGERFGLQTRDVEVETGAAVRGAEEQFRRQERRMEGLEARVRAGKGRVETLSAKLEEVRRRVEAAEERDGEGRRRRVKGLRRVGWGCVLGLGVVVLVGWAWQMGGLDGFGLVGGVGGGGKGNGSFWEMPMREGTLGAEDLKSGLEGLRGPDLSSESLGKVGVDDGGRGEQSKGRVDAEATLRLFDEL